MKHDKVISLRICTRFVIVILYCELVYTNEGSIYSFLRKIKMKKRLLVTCMSMGFAPFAFAGGDFPTYANKCKDLGMVSPNNAMGVHYNSSCTIAYVLPPKVGSVAVGAVATNGNLGFCPALGMDRKAASLNSETRLIIEERIKKMIEEYDPLKKSSQQAQKAFDDASIDYKLVQEKYNAYQTAKDKFEGVDIPQARAKYNSDSAIDPSSEATKASKARLEQVIADYKNLIASSQGLEDSYYSKKNHLFES